MGAESSLPEDGLKPHTAGEEHDNPAAVRLAVPTQPGHEFVHCLLALWRHAVVLPLEQPVDQDRQLVNREDHRPLVCGERRKDFVPLLSPVSGVDTGAQFYLDL